MFALRLSRKASKRKPLPIVVIFPLYQKIYHPGFGKICNINNTGFLLSTCITYKHIKSGENAHVFSSFLST